MSDAALHTTTLKTPLEMIAEWRKGCTGGGPVLDQIEGAPLGTHSPAECVECTEALIDALEKRLEFDVGQQCPVGPGPHREIREGR